MNKYRRPARRSSNGSAPLIAFLLIAGFGILFAGCSSNRSVTGPEGDAMEDVTFTADDVAAVQKETEGLSENLTAGTGSTDALPSFDVTATQSGSSTEPPKVDVSMVPTYNGLRMMASTAGSKMFRVNNDTLKMRSKPSTTAPVLKDLVRGDMVQMIDFTNASWANVQLATGEKGYVSARYIAKVTSEDKVAEEKKAYEGTYFVHFNFVNVRATPDPKSEKLGEIPKDAFVKPLSLDAKWARISFEGREGYISTDYITAFTPAFLVRQDTYKLPILHYDASQPGMVEQMVQHVSKLKQAGYKFLTLRDFYDLVLAQEKRDTKLDPKSVVLVLSELNAENIKTVSAALSSNSIRATLFLQTGQVGITGITEKNLLTLMANNFDLQSGGHTGDDLRSLTNAQVKLELEQSRALLEQYTKKTVFAIGYPQGGVNDRVLEMAASAGYLFGLGGAPGVSFSRDQFLRLPAITVTSAMTADDLITALK